MNFNRLKIVVGGAILWALFAAYNLWDDYTKVITAYDGTVTYSTYHTPILDIIFPIILVFLVGVLVGGISIFLYGPQKFFEWMDLDV